VTVRVEVQAVLPSPSGDLQLVATALPRDEEEIRLPENGRSSQCYGFPLTAIESICQP
jgi:hypothetical protein